MSHGRCDTEAKSPRWARAAGGPSRHKAVVVAVMLCLVEQRCGRSAAEAKHRVPRDQVLESWLGCPIETIRVSVEKGSELPLRFSRKDMFFFSSMLSGANKFAPIVGDI